MSALDEAIGHFGTPSSLAVAAGVSPQVINNAKRRGSVSPELALAIEQATKGLITKERLVWGDSIAKAKKAA